MTFHHPRAFLLQQTLSTLRYAARAKNIKNKAKVNEDPKDALLREYKEEIDKLKAMLAAANGGVLPATDAASLAASADAALAAALKAPRRKLSADDLSDSDTEERGANGEDAEVDDDMEEFLAASDLAMFCSRFAAKGVTSMDQLLAPWLRAAEGFLADKVGMAPLDVTRFQAAVDARERGVTPTRRKAAAPPRAMDVSWMGGDGDNDGDDDDDDGLSLDGDDEGSVDGGGSRKAAPKRRKSKGGGGASGAGVAEQEEERPGPVDVDAIAQGDTVTLVVMSMMGRRRAVMGQVLEMNRAAGRLTVWDGGGEVTCALQDVTAVVKAPPSRSVSAQKERPSSRSALAARVRPPAVAEEEKEEEEPAAPGKGPSQGSTPKPRPKRRTSDAGDCTHACHEGTIEGLRDVFGVRTQACPQCKLVLPPRAQQLFEEAMRRYWEVRKVIEAAEIRWSDITQAQQREMGDVLEMWGIAADNGHATAQCSLGSIYFNGHGTKRSHAEAARLYRLAAEQGLARAQALLGDMTRQGQGVARDYAEAVRWFRLACAEGGHADAQCSLGLIYFEGQAGAVERDFSEAARWFKRSAEQLYVPAQFNLGELYHSGQGVAQDHAEAVRWYRKAAEQGHPSAQVNLGLQYANGQGVARDPAEAVKWFRLAAEQGDPDAQHNLGAMYHEGDGVEQDYGEGARWLRLSAEQGHEEAKTWMAKLLKVKPMAAPLPLNTPPAPLAAAPPPIPPPPKRHSATAASSSRNPTPRPARRGPRRSNSLSGEG